MLDKIIRTNMGSAKEPAHFIWLIDEISLAVITAVILLIPYNWHLRAVVGAKTRELKNFNGLLKDKVEVRTAELKNEDIHSKTDRYL